MKKRTGESDAVTLESREDLGLKRARQDHYSLELTDLKLPGLNGLELVDRLHAAQPRLQVEKSGSALSGGALEKREKSGET
jgi:CheY-like chemotaxis protein